MDTSTMTVILVSIVIFLYVNRDKLGGNVGGSGGNGGTTTTNVSVGSGSTGGSTQGSGSSVSGNTGDEGADDHGISIVPAPTPQPLRPVFDTPPENIQTPTGLQYPKVGDSIAGLRYQDLRWPDGSPRIMTWSMIANIADPGVRALYTSITDIPTLANYARNQPDIIAWVSY